MAVFDALIIGGGIVGGSMLRSLKGMKCLLVESSTKEQIMARSSSRVVSLTPRSVQLLRGLGVWKKFSGAQPYSNMVVWEDSARIKFQHEPFIGQIVKNDQLVKALFEDTNDVLYGKKVIGVDFGHVQSVKLQDGSTLKARVVIGADGGNSFVRDQAGLESQGFSYPQLGLIANLQVQGNTTAWQKFLPTGPIAILPVSEQEASLVWTMPVEMAQRMKQLDSRQFVQILNACLSRPFHEVQFLLEAVQSEDSNIDIEAEVHGRPVNDIQVPHIDQASERMTFPLKFRKTSPYIAQGVALIGDSAHQVHPMAGLGLNLGLSDVEQLAAVLQEAYNLGQDLGSVNVLREYNQKQMAMNSLTMGSIDTLWNLYHQYNSGPDASIIDQIVSMSRAYGMSTVEKYPVLKQAIIRQAMSV